MASQGVDEGKQIALDMKVEMGTEKLEDAPPEDAKEKTSNHPTTKPRAHAVGNPGDKKATTRPSVSHRGLVEGIFEADEARRKSEKLDPDVSVSPRRLVEGIFEADEARFKSENLDPNASATREEQLDGKSPASPSLVRGSARPGTLPGAFPQGPTNVTAMAFEGQRGQEETRTSEIDTNIDPLERVESGNASASELHQDNTGLAVAQPVGESGNQNADAVEAQEYVPPSPDERRAKELARKKSLCIKLACFLLVVIAFVVWILRMAGVFDEEETATLAPRLEVTTAPSVSPTEEPLLIPLPQSTTEAIGGDPDSPQARAYEWLKNDPMLDSAEERQLLQRFALATFYFATNGEDWFINDGWLDGTLHECKWKSKPAEAQNSTSGPCNQQGEYLSLIMTANGLLGEMPGELAMLTSLQSLDIATNEITGLIPSELGLMSSLRHLSIDNNELTGLFPSELMQLRSLELLQVQSNGITGTFPSQLGLLTNLTELLWFDTMTGGTVPTEIGMAKLELLYLQGNPITGTIPSQIGLLTNMESLQWSYTMSTGMIPTELGLLSRLRRMQLENQMFSGSIPTQMGGMTSLSSNVEIHSNLLTGPIPSEIGQLINLREFYAFGMSLTGVLPSQVGLMEALASIDVEMNQLTSTIPTELGKCSLLWNLWLRGNDFTGHIPSELGLFSSMERFYIDTNQLVSTIPLELCWGMDRSRILSLGQNQLDGTLPPDCFVNKTALEEFYVDGTDISGPIPSEIGLVSASLEFLRLANTSLTGPLPSSISSLTGISLLDLQETQVSGEIPEELCAVPDLKFDCSGVLCGCDCMCNNTLASNSTS